MNDVIINELSNSLNISIKSIKSTLELLENGNTIPFIARYRKEVTGNLNETEIRAIETEYNYQVNLQKRKDEIKRLIEEKGLLTDELVNKIDGASKLVEIEDIYRPFKEKKKTKATDAINNGLEPLAKMIMSFNVVGNIYDIAKKYLNDSVKTEEDAIIGAKYIIAEWISDNAYYRKQIRYLTYMNGILASKKKKNSEDELKTYEMYYDFNEPVKSIKLYRVLAINRGESENILSVNVDVKEDIILDFLKSKVIRNASNEEIVSIVEAAIKDSYKRLISPSIEREIRSELKEKAEDVAINNFSDNLEKLLMQPPIKEKVILGFDPAYRTGCKLAVIDKTGKPLRIAVIYPHEPKNEYEKSKEIILRLIDQYNIDVIAIGNGTASRESETFIADVIKTCPKKVEYIIVNEAGASVYSASKLAIAEFPDLHVEERSAISIGRRLSDPLSELVKIDPESIGVGLYQHDVTDKKLKESLNFIVEKVVNQVGVNLNTASASILKYISGLTKSTIDKIIKYRDQYGMFKSREELLKKKILNDKTYEQAIGFLRVLNGTNILDMTSIHPESYDTTLKLLNHLALNMEMIGTDAIRNNLLNVNVDKLSKELNVDKYTLQDIIDSLVKPNRDPRDMLPKPLLKKDVLHLEDLKVGMKLQGTVRNVVDFGAFVDIGIKNDGLVHISKMTDRFIKHPSEIVNVGDIIDVYVDSINIEKQKVSLSMKQVC
ncbi:MAG: RNA-binding transcriptional accessory protein [Firmicutes bacterium]|nr:RNA-binding transcriptional accessory protein [Bacillota bacterium]